VLELVAEFADSPEEIVALSELFGGILGAVQAASEALDVVIQPRHELFAREAVGVLAEQGETNGPEGELGFRRLSVSTDVDFKEETDPLRVSTAAKLLQGAGKGPQGAWAAAASGAWASWATLVRVAASGT
jgi:hypothetical protein